MVEKTYQTKQTFWQKAKNAAKESIKKNAPKVKAAAKTAGRKAMEGGRWAAIEAYKAYEKGRKTPQGKHKGRKAKSRHNASSKTAKRRIVIEDY